MIIGIGTDIVDIARIEQLLQRQGARFVERVLCAEEILVYHRHVDGVAYLAKRFAAKEAASKAFGTGIGELSWQDFSILNDAHGAPVLRLTGRAAQLLRQRGGRQALLSLSDERQFAVAFVVLTA